MELWNKLDEVEKTYREVESRMAEPGVASNPAEMQVLGKKHVELEPIVAAYHEYKRVAGEIEDARAMLAAESDEEMRAMAREELATLEEQLPGLEKEIHILLLPRDVNDDRNVVIEIRGGTGSVKTSGPRDVFIAVRTARACADQPPLRERARAVRAAPE